MGKIRPLHDNVLMRRERPTEMTRGGIVLAQSAQEKSLRGEVLAVGPGRVNEHGVRVGVDVKPGDIAIVGNKFIGQEIDFEGEIYLIVRGCDVSSVVEP